MPQLFEPIKFRSVELKNRIGVSPMCEYSAHDGFINDWHFVHLGSRAVGGAALVIMEATGVEARGRISLGDTGIYADAHVEPLKRLTAFIKAQGAVPGIQLAHAGRKASRTRPWEGDGNLADADGGWEVIGPSPLAYSDRFRVPVEMNAEEIARVQTAFVEATRRALAAGFRWIEIHAAHGYLFHNFLSPLSNARTDQYGGSFDNRCRFLLETAKRVRAAWPAELPLAVRLSCSDWVAGGWTIEDSVALAQKLKAEAGIDLIDCSSGGNVSAKIPVGPGYQVSFAETIRRDAKIPTAAVGMITEPEQAEAILAAGQADVVLLAREFLRDPYWPRRAAKQLGAELAPPNQYLRSW